MSFETDHIGRFTSSGISKIVNSGKLTLTNEKEIYLKVWELLTGQLKDVWNYSIQWGIDHEPEAVGYYILSFGDRNVTNTVDDQIFIPDGDHAGCTPDGLINSDGTLEVKCPKNGANHTRAFDIGDRLTFKQFNKDYFYQVQDCLRITEREYCDFVSYDPRVPSSDRQIVRRIYRDEEEIKTIERCLKMAIEEKVRILNKSKYKK